MLNEILKLEGAQALSSIEQKEVNGGAGGWGFTVLDIILFRARNLFWDTFNSTNRNLSFKLLAANLAVINVWGLGILRILQQRGMVRK
jgi:hypothetical protein